MKKTNEYILLKWGTIKSWYFGENQKAKDIFNKMELSASAMMQVRDEKHNTLVCELIDAINGSIINDWDGEDYTKERAKKYILEYGK